MKTFLRSVFLFSLVCCAASVFAFDDEPNELNWDRLGGSLTSFAHFYDYVQANPDFRAKLLAQTPSDPKKYSLQKNVASVWISPRAFESRLENGWSIGSAADRDVLAYPSGHGGGFTRTIVSVPKSGFYRVWAEYYHEQGSIASFILRLEDPKGPPAWPDADARARRLFLRL